VTSIHLSDQYLQHTCITYEAHIITTRCHECHSGAIVQCYIPTDGPLLAVK